MRYSWLCKLPTKWKIKDIQEREPADYCEAGRQIQPVTGSKEVASIDQTDYNNIVKENIGRPRLLWSQVCDTVTLASFWHKRRTFILTFFAYLWEKDLDHCLAQSYTFQVHDLQAIALINCFPLVGLFLDHLTPPKGMNSLIPPSFSIGTP